MCVVVFVPSPADPSREVGRECVVVFVPSPADPSRDVGRECVCLCSFPHRLTPRGT